MRRRSLVLQAGVAAGLIALLALLVITVNLLRTGLGLDFTWLGRPAGFALAESALPFHPTAISGRSPLAGSTASRSSGLVWCWPLLGVAAGAARRRIDFAQSRGGYVALIRQCRLQLLFWYFVAFLGLNTDWWLDPALQPVSLSAPQRGVLRRIDRPHGVHRGLAEIVRGGINAVPRGQWEAFRSV